MRIRASNGSSLQSNFRGIAESEEIQRTETSWFRYRVLLKIAEMHTSEEAEILFKSNLGCGYICVYGYSQLDTVKPQSYKITNLFLQESNIFSDSSIDKDTFVFEK